jgi:RND family efflux transporter MFP subunit
MIRSRPVYSLYVPALRGVAWACLVAVLFAGSTNSTSAAADDILLATHVVDRRNVGREQVFDGVVEAVNRSTVSAQTAGEIIELPFDVNDYVPKGAVVIRFDDTKQKARYDKAVAGEAEARARLVEAKDSFEREKRLLKQDATSKAKFENARANLESARAKLALSEAAVAEAKKELDHTLVKAPYSGIIVERFVEIGEEVQVGQPLGTGLSLEELRVVAEVPGRYIDKVRERRDARVFLPGGGKDPITVESLTIFPYADPKTHTFTVRINLARGEYGLYPGMLTKVAFKVGEARELVVPADAIVHRSEVTGVYVVADDGRVSFRQIRTGKDSDDGWIVVLAGLEAGEKVALDPGKAAIKHKRRLAGEGHE